MKDKLLKQEIIKKYREQILQVNHNGGLVALDALIKNFKEMSEVVGGNQSLKILEFISLVELFRSEYEKLLNKYNDIKKDTG